MLVARGKVANNTEISLIRESHLAKFLFSITFILCCAGAATAQSIPRYNVNSYCQQVAEVSGGSAMIFNGCIDMEQQAYDSLKSSWSIIPNNSRNYCDQVAQVTGGSYIILESCVDMENNAEDSPHSFNY